MPLEEDLELLNAALALAMIDGKLSRAEMGVIEGLANRIGVGQISLEHMIGRARRDPEMYKDLRVRGRKRAHHMMELLVAHARIDGEISDEERDVLVKIAMQLDIDTEDFRRIYADAVTRADEIRKRRESSAESG